MDYKWAWEKLEDNGYAHYLDLSDGFPGIFTCQNSSNCTL